MEGISVDKSGELRSQIKTLSAATAAYLGLDVDLLEGDFILHEAYSAPGYGVITDAEREAIRLLACSEGILADPVYTGRALAGLIDLIRQGVYGGDETVLFWHTGGVPGLFARAAEMS